VFVVMAEAKLAADEEGRSIQYRASISLHVIGLQCTL